jgi:hypothetical protein
MNAAILTAGTDQHVNYVHEYKYYDITISNFILKYTVFTFEIADLEPLKGNTVLNRYLID